MRRETSVIRQNDVWAKPKFRVVTSLANMNMDRLARIAFFGVEMKAETVPAEDLWAWVGELLFGRGDASGNGTGLGLNLEVVAPVTAAPSSVILNSFQDPSWFYCGSGVVQTRLPQGSAYFATLEQATKWTLKRVQGDGYLGVK